MGNPFPQLSHRPVLDSVILKKILSRRESPSANVPRLLRPSGSGLHSRASFVTPSIRWGILDARCLGIAPAGLRLVLNTLLSRRILESSGTLEYTMRNCISRRTSPRALPCGVRTWRPAQIVEQIRRCPRVARCSSHGVARATGAPAEYLMQLIGLSKT